MIIDQPGKVTETITLLGKPENCVYLVDGGDAYAILGGGLPNTRAAARSWCCNVIPST